MHKTNLFRHHVTIGTDTLTLSVFKYKDTFIFEERYNNKPVCASTSDFLVEALEALYHTAMEYQEVLNG